MKAFIVAYYQYPFVYNTYFTALLLLQLFYAVTCWYVIDWFENIINYTVQLPL